MLLHEKKRTSLDAAIRQAGLKQYGSRYWEPAHETRALGLIRDALLRGNSLPAAMYVLFHKDVLFALGGIEKYEFDGTMPPLEFLEASIRSKTFPERFEILELLLGLANDSRAEPVQKRQVLLAHQFLSHCILEQFARGTAIYPVAAMLEDSLKNFRDGWGYHGDLPDFASVARALQGLTKTL